MSAKESVQIGNNPWSREDLRSHLEEFLDLYKMRPIKNNNGGQKSVQLFYSWFVAKKLQPEFIIESGVFQGQGTWAFEKASPRSKIICLDPFLKTYLRIKSSKAQYFETDFKKIDWSFIQNKENVLCFFDDHQNAFERINQLKAFGFKKAMFEDNYPPGHGDCLSLKKVLEENDLNQKDWLESQLKTYLEFPPMFNLKTSRWGNDWSTYRSNSPLIDVDDAKFHTYKEDMDQFTWINYVELP